MSRSRTTAQFMCAVVGLEALSVVLLYVDLGLRGPFSLDENFRLFWKHQLVRFANPLLCASCTGNSQLTVGVCVSRVAL